MDLQRPSDLYSFSFLDSPGQELRLQAFQQPADEHLGGEVAFD
jgi:hypothetical protein